jgi:hypothetical protein
MYAYVRNSPLKNTDPDGRDCQNGFGACLNYIWGGVKSVINTVPNAATAVNRVIDPAIAWTAGNLGKPGKPGNGNLGQYPQIRVY